MSEKYFDSQQDDEKIILVVRRHIISLLDSFALTAFLYLIGFAAIFILPIVIPSIIEGFAFNIYVLAVSLLFVFSTTFIFSAWVMHYLTVCILTNEHFVDIVQSGLFSRKISSLSLDKIQDTSAFQAGFLNTLLNLGTVEVQTAGEAPNFIIPNVPDPNSVSQKIMEVEEDFAHNYGMRSINNQKTSSTEELNTQSVQDPSPNIEFPSNNDTNNLN